MDSKRMSLVCTEYSMHRNLTVCTSTFARDTVMWP